VISRILSKTRRSSDDHFSGTPVPQRLERPTRKSVTDRANPWAAEDGNPAPLFGLAPGGVCRARPVARSAGELLPRRFTLTEAGRRPASAVCFLWHFPYPTNRAVGVTHHRALRSPDFPPPQVPEHLLKSVPARRRSSTLSPTRFHLMHSLLKTQPSSPKHYAPSHSDSPSRISSKPRKLSHQFFIPDCSVYPSILY
jgi:hypothetical protein